MPPFSSECRLARSDRSGLTRGRIGGIRGCFSAAVFGFLISCLWVPLLAQEEARRNFSLPADMAAKTLKLFSEQAGRGIIATSEIIKGVRTQPVEGEFTAREALERMLIGTGLIGLQDGRNGAFVVRRKPAQPATESDRPAKNKAAQSDSTSDPSAPPTPFFRRMLALGAALTASVASARPPAWKDGNGERVVLSPFEVSTPQDKSYQAANTLSGFGINTPINRLPQTLQVATRQLMQDLALDSGDLIPAMEVASSSVVRRSYNNGDDQFMWGFRLAQSVRDGVPVGATNPLGVLYDIDRIEAIKGPAAALFGQASAIGGLINYVPRKPSSVPKYRFDVSVGSFDRKTFAIHAAGPITNQIRYRLDLGWAENGGGRQFSFYKDKFVGAGFEVDLSPSALLSMEFGKSWAHRMNSWTILDFSSTERYPKVDPRLGDTLSVNAPFDDYGSARATAAAKALITLPGGFASMTSLSWNQVRIDVNRTQVQTISADRNLLSRQTLFPFVVNEHNTFFVQSFSKTLKTGPFAHKLGLSLDARFQTSVAGVRDLRDPMPLQPGEVFTTTLYQMPRFNLNNPQYYGGNLETGFAGTMPKVNNRITGGTLYDIVSMWDDKLNVMFNFRYNDQLQTSGLPVPAYQSVPADPFQTVAMGSVLTRRYAATVEPVKDVLVYYNVGEAFIFNPGLDYLNKPLIPSIGQNKEIGVKATFFDGAVAVSAAHFNIVVSNVRVTFIEGPNDPQPGLSAIAQSGSQRNAGYDFSANVSRHFGPGTVNMILTQYMGNLRNEVGHKVAYVANQTSSIWGTFSFENGPLKGFKTGLGSNYTGERIGPLMTAQAVQPLRQTWVAPYWKSRGMVSYSRKHFNIQLNVDNIADKKAIVGFESALWIQTDPGRTWKLSSSYNF